MTPPRTRDPRRGSVLIVVLLLTAMLVLVLGSQMDLGLATERHARRVFDRQAAFQLAEAGVEEAVWSYNQTLAGASGWDGWQTSGKAAWRKFTDFTLTPGSTGEVKVYATDTTAAAPLVVAQASVQTGSSAPLTQMVEITLRRRGYFANGLVALRRFVINGNNTTFDSWDSDPDRDAGTPPVDYSAAVRSDLGGIAVGATDAANLSIGQGILYGYFTTAGLTPTVTGKGRIGPFGTGEGQVDATRLATDFTASFPIIGAPSDGTWIDTLGDTLGTPGQSTRWRTSHIKLSGQKTLTILGDVTLILTAQADTDAISVNSALTIPEGSSLTIYFEGNASIAGQGLVNNNVQPSKLVLWGGNTTERGQKIDITGRATLRAVLYAPNGDLSLTGNGDLMGAIVARDITFSGNAAFHYDRSLEALTTYGTFGVQSWEYVAPDAQSARNGLFTGW